jgi:hypothetical protein
VLACPLRRKQLELYPFDFQPPLHPSLLEKIDEPISRSEGLKSALYEIYIDLANDQPIVLS